MEKRDKLFFWLLGIFVFVFILSAFLFFSVKRPIDSVKMEVLFSVDEFVGISHSSERLDYGSLLPGMSSEKFVVLSNKKDFEIEVVFFVEDSINKFLFGEERVFLSPFEEMNYSLVLNVPEDIEFGNYSGELRMDFYKA